VVEEVSDKAEIRQSPSSLLSAAVSFRRPALTVMVLGAAAVGAYRFISFWLVPLGWVAFIVLAHPPRRRRGQ
jgi:hypothetical protein